LHNETIHVANNSAFSGQSLAIFRGIYQALKKRKKTDKTHMPLF
jgi:hypothetical protein